MQSGDINTIKDIIAKDIIREILNKSEILNSATSLYTEASRGVLTQVSHSDIVERIVKNLQKSIDLEIKMLDTEYDFIESVEQVIRNKIINKYIIDEIDTPLYNYMSYPNTSGIRANNHVFCNVISKFLDIVNDAFMAQYNHYTEFGEKNVFSKLEHLKSFEESALKALNNISLLTLDYHPLNSIEHPNIIAQFKAIKSSLSEQFTTFIDAVIRNKREEKIFGIFSRCKYDIELIQFNKMIIGSISLATDKYFRFVKNDYNSFYNYKQQKVTKEIEDDFVFNLSVEEKRDILLAFKRFMPKSEGEIFTQTVQCEGELINHFNEYLIHEVCILFRVSKK